jgi:hypothetical protein
MFHAKMYLCSLIFRKAPPNRSSATFSETTTPAVQRAVVVEVKTEPVTKVRIFKLFLFIFQLCSMMNNVLLEIHVST